MTEKKMSTEDFRAYREDVMKKLIYNDLSRENEDFADFTDEEKRDVRNLRGNLINTYAVIKDFLIDDSLANKEVDEFVISSYRSSLLEKLRDSSWDFETKKKSIENFRGILKNTRIYGEWKDAYVQKDGKKVIEKVFDKTYYVYKYDEKTQNPIAQKSDALHEIKNFFKGWSQKDFNDVINSYYINDLGKGVESIDLASVNKVISDYAAGKLTDKQFKILDGDIAEQIANFKISARVNYQKSKKDKEEKE